jgi:ankyrin repeat protein
MSSSEESDLEEQSEESEQEPTIIYYIHHFYDYKNDQSGFEQILASLSLEEINETDSQGNTALHIVFKDDLFTALGITKSGLYDLIEFLLNLGVNPNILNDSGMYAIEYAELPSSFYEQILQLFMVYGFDINGTSHINGNTMLIRYLYRRFQQNTFEILLRNGADPNVINNIGQFPLQLLIRTSDSNITRVRNLINLFLKYNANINLKDLNGNNILYYANVSLEMLLLEYVPLGLDVNNQNIEGSTPLHHFLDNHRLSMDILISFIKAGANFNLVDNNGISVYALLGAKLHGLDIDDIGTYTIEDLEDEGRRRINFLKQPLRAHTFRPIMLSSLRSPNVPVLPQELYDHMAPFLNYKHEKKQKIGFGRSIKKRNRLRNNRLKKQSKNKKSMKKN